MNSHDVACGKVVSVLLADGWHPVVTGTFTVGPLCFDPATGPDRPGFRFEEADAASPYRPRVLVGPLDSILAVRQVTHAARGNADPDLSRAAHNGQHAVQGTRPRVRAVAL
jgi:hypothetical protein